MTPETVQLKDVLTQNKQHTRALSGLGVCTYISASGTLNILYMM